MAGLDYLQVARICNQKCVFCSNPENGRVLEWEEAAALIDSFKEKGSKEVILTGGEPTLFPELPRLIAYARGKGQTVRMITNGQRTCRLDYLDTLAKAGLEHMHVSVHSHREDIQAQLTGNPESLPNIARTLENADKLGVRVDVNTVINRVNAGHLSRIVEWLVGSFPFLKHFVWNNLDPMMNRASLNPEIVPRLRDLETELCRAMRFLDSTGRTFRVERVPLCFMSEFPHRSTETRKLVKDEHRRIYFLDEKGLKDQSRISWTYPKPEGCRACTLDGICAGLYQMDVYYSSKELCPQFVMPEPIAAKVLEGG
jgi:MoaA/NifB/PqqE/SkfB family radical SAM enzyme